MKTTLKCVSGQEENSVSQNVIYRGTSESIYMMFGK
jgi:hypothetical protein